MKLENFIQNAISSIRENVEKTGDEISDVQFELFVDVQGEDIIIADSKLIENLKKNLNKLKFSIKTKEEKIDIQTIVESME